MSHDDRRADALAKALDEIAILDLACLGVASYLYLALESRQPGPMCMGAARFMLNALKRTRQTAPPLASNSAESPNGRNSHAGPGRSPVVMIATGFPMGGGVPETDGPVGAAMLARALAKTCGARSVIVTDEAFVEAVKAACIGAGLAPRLVAPDGLEQVSYLNAVHILPFPLEDDACRARCDTALDSMNPALMVAVERPGKNIKGVYHGMNGRPLAGYVADIEPLFSMARERGAPFLAIGDGGNEVGMGLIREDLSAVLPQAEHCGCPCGGGAAAVLEADYLVTASVSNWGAACVIAALSVLTDRPDALHAPEEERRAIELCANSGAVDGVSLSPVPAVDGVSAEEWEGLMTVLHGMVRRGVTDQGDWRRDVHSQSP